LFAFIIRIYFIKKLSCHINTPKLTLLVSMVEQLLAQNVLFEILRKYFLTKSSISFQSLLPYRISAVVLVLLRPQKLAHPLHYYQL